MSPQWNRKRILSLAQIQDFQDKVNSLNDASECYDPGICEPLWITPRPQSTHGYSKFHREMISRDSCLQPGTWNSFGTSGNVFESLPIREGPSSALFGNSMNLGIIFLRIEANWDRQNLGTGRRSETRTFRVLQYQLVDWPRVWRPEIHYAVLEELSLGLV